MIGSDEKAAARAAVEAQIARIAEAEREARRPPPRLVIEDEDKITRGIKKGELITFSIADFDDGGIKTYALATRDIPPKELTDKIRQVGYEGKYSFCFSLRAALIKDGAAVALPSTNIVAFDESSRVNGDVLAIDVWEHSAEKDSEENDI